MSQYFNFSIIKNEIKEILAIGIPLVSSQLIYACSGFLGTAMVAHIDQDSLAASALVSTIWMALSVLFFGILNAISILVSHQYGAKNNRAISEIMGQAYLFGLLICFALVLILCSIPWLLHFSTQPQRVLTLANEYIYALLWTIPGLVILIISEQFLIGINRSKIVLRLSLLVVPVEIFLMYILIFGHLGLPKFGVAGIGYSFAIAHSVTAIGLLLYFRRSYHFTAFNIRDNLFPIKKDMLKELITIGLPMGLMHVIEVGTFAIITFWMAKFGTTMLAAHQIVLQYLGFAITLVFAMSQAATVRVGHAVGQQNKMAVQYASYTVMLLNSFCVLVIALAFNLAPDFFLRIDIDIHHANNLILMRDTISLLSISGVLLIFDNFRIIGFGVLRGLKDTRFPMYASFISFGLVGLTSAYYLSFIWQWQGKGIWWGMTLGIAVGAIIVLTRIHYLLKHIDLSRILRVYEK